MTTEGQDERDEQPGDGNKRQRQGERAEVVDDGGEMAEAGGEAGTAARSAAICMSTLPRVARGC